MSQDLIQLIIINAPNFIGFALLAWVLVRELRELRAFLFKIIIMLLDDDDLTAEKLRDRINGDAPK